LFAQLVSKIFNLCDHDPPTSDRQTDGQTTCDRKTALCTIVHRGAVKTNLTNSTIQILKLGFWADKVNYDIRIFKEEWVPSAKF